MRRGGGAATHLPYLQLHASPERTVGEPAREFIKKNGIDERDGVPLAGFIVQAAAAAHRGRVAASLHVLVARVVIFFAPHI